MIAWYLRQDLAVKVAVPLLVVAAIGAHVLCVTTADTLGDAVTNTAFVDTGVCGAIGVLTLLGWAVDKWG